MVVSNNSTTRICVIDAEEASQVFRHFAPLHSVGYVVACEAAMSRDEAWRTLRDNGYTYLYSDQNAVFVVVSEMTDEKGVLIAEGVADVVFDVKEPRPQVVRPASSQAGLATLSR